MIELKDLSKTFNLGLPNSFCALAGINARIDSGKVTVFQGPSGSGKTTLLALIGCMLSPTTGRILIDGEEVTSLTERFASEARQRLFGFVFQDLYLIPGVSALENVMLPAYPTGIAPARLRRRAMELLDGLGVSALAGRAAEHLSGGERQRVAVARALINKPRIVIADEPTAHLDTQTALRFLEILSGLRGEGRTVLIASHDPLLSQGGAADRVITLSGGRIQEEI